MPAYPFFSLTLLRNIKEAKKFKLRFFFEKKNRFCDLPLIGGLAAAAVNLKLFLYIVQQKYIFCVFFLYLHVVSLNIKTYLC